MIIRPSLLFLTWILALAFADLLALPAHSQSLSATITSRQTEFRSSTDAQIKVVVQNTGNRKVVVNLYVLKTPTLSVEVLNAKGERMATVPPPVPPSNLKKYDTVLRPGAKMALEYSLDLFNPELPEGTYRVKMRDMKTNELE